MNMPMDNIMRAIKRGTGELPGVHYESHTYEGYGPHGIAVIVETLTDNKNRTVADLRRILSSGGGSLAENGSVSWMFHRLGVLRINNGISEDELLDTLIDFDVHDISRSDNDIVISCDPKCLEDIKKTCLEMGLAVESAEVEMVAPNLISLDDTQADTVVTFLDELEEHDDVQNVYANLA
jgi:YebC/PmpR family DNA-binding regulatory protein